jgi:hypothetical protein
MVMILAIPLLLSIAHLVPLSAQFDAAPKNGGVSAGQPADADVKGPAWVEIEANYVDAFYEEGVDPGTVERRLRKRIYFFGRSAPDDLSMEGKIAYRLDALFDRVREILDMHPQMPRLSIRIFASEDSLREKYREFSGSDEEDLKAFYVQAYETIYTSEETITDSVMSHELAHAIIDHYFTVIPSSKVSEILASYVDMHISE